MDANMTILGNGSVGVKIANMLAHFGYVVALGSRRVRTEGLSDSVRAMTLQDAANASDTILSALPWSLEGTQISVDVLRSLKGLEGKTIVDMTNPLNADWSPLSLGEESSAGEITAAALPASYVVKAFNTVFADMMDSAKIAALPVRPLGLLCGESAEAKATVAQVLERIGFAAVDAGGIASARYLEQMAHLNIQLAVGQGGGTGAALAYLKVE